MNNQLIMRKIKKKSMKLYNKDAFLKNLDITR